MSESPIAPPRTIADATPECVLAPKSLAELQAIVAADDGMTLVPVGGGTRLDLGHAPSQAFALLELAGALTGEIVHEPEDMTVVVPASATIGAINAQIRASGQRLTLDPPHPDRATVGGTLAVGAGGPLRTRYGLPRDTLLGITLLRSDGELVHAGGRVVKNVTGYDLMRMWTGSLGTLGILVSASLRVQPIPESVDIAVRGLSLGEALTMANAVYLADCRPELADVILERERWTLLVRVPAPLAALARSVAPGAVAEEWLDLYGRSRDAGFAEDDHLAVRIAGTRSAIEGIAATIHRLEATTVVARPLAGTIVAGWSAGDMPPLRRLSPEFAAIRRDLAASGGSLIIDRMPDSWRPDVDPWGEPPGSFPIMRRLKDAYDGRLRLNAGRFCGAI